MIVAVSILAALALLLLCPVHVRATLFDGKAQVAVRYLFFRFLLPREGKARAKSKAPAKTKKAKKAKKGRRSKKEEPEQAWDGESIRAAITLGRDLLALIGRSGTAFLRKVKIKELKLEVMVVRRDAFQTAVKSGELNAIVHGAAAILCNYAEIGFLYVNIYPGFWAVGETVAFETKLSFRPGRVFLLFLALVIGGISPVRAFLAAQKTAEETGDT